jgi:hypothetical protein
VWVRTATEEKLYIWILAFWIRETSILVLSYFWPLLKRGISGTYISVEPFHLVRYLDEQTFQFNHRKGMKDGDRLDIAVRHIVGRRLTYAEVTGKVGERPATYRNATARCGFSEKPVC